ncbi:MAG: hypothetical protein ACETVM_01155 [Candidatus Bathyarchaeia archaeon]
MKTKVALLLILLVFAFTPIITTLATTLITPTINLISLAKATACNVIFEIQRMPDPIDNPVGPG